MSIARAERITAGSARMALFNLGFRPFYLLAALYAALMVPLWVLAYRGFIGWPSGLTPYLWHAHEMVYGFAVAVVVGFLFTAVRNWTGLPTPAGKALAGFALAWIAARAAWVAGAVGVAVAIEVAFLAAVAAALLRLLVSKGNRRNYFVGGLFLVLALVDVAFWAGQSGRLAVEPVVFAETALFLVVTLTFVMGGRVIPSFTANAIPRLKQYRNARVDQAAIGVGVAVFVAHVAGANGLVVGALAALAALLHAVRLWGWNPWATRRIPIVWILHASYAWVPMGFALLAASALGWGSPVLAVHAFSVGVVGGLIIAMITRTALGHTGRKLAAGTSEVAMYVLVQLAALARVFGPIVYPEAYRAWVDLASTFWSLAFLVYFIVYLPRLAQARADGMPG